MDLKLQLPNNSSKRRTIGLFMPPSLSHSIYLFLFSNSGTLKGARRVFKESQGFLPASPTQARPSIVVHAHSKQVLKTNDKATLLVLVPQKRFKNHWKFSIFAVWSIAPPPPKASKTNEKSTCYPFARSDGVPQESRAKKSKQKVNPSEKRAALYPIPLVYQKPSST